MDASNLSITLIACLFLAQFNVISCQREESVEDREDSFPEMLKQLMDDGNGTQEIGLAKCFLKQKDMGLWILNEIFPPNWPAANSEDPLCADKEVAKKFICDRDNITSYMTYVVPTEDPNQIPSDACSMSKGLGGCLPGFYDHAGRPMPCCDGFFCPAFLNCMIPCPMGARCTRAVAEDGPSSYQTEDAGKWCAPYGYKVKNGKCGGADKWRVNPLPAFHGTEWEHGNGNIYCPGGKYCPNTTMEPIACPENHHCRPGSIAPAWCPPLVNCRKGSKMPQDNFKGLALDALVFLLLLVVWQASKLHKWLLRKMNARDRIKLQFWSLEFGFSFFRPVLEVVKGPSSPLMRSQGARETNRLQKWTLSLRKHLQRISVFSREQPSDVEMMPVNRGQCDAGGNGAGGEGTSHDTSHRNEVVNNEPFGVFGDYTPQVDILRERVTRLKVEFYCLSLRLKSCRKSVLAAASGVLPESQLTAIMGPSGSGKTSLLNVLSGRAGYGSVSGVILVNGEEGSLGKYKHVMGFVPQDDSMHPDLTVEEHLLFSARYRLPGKTPHSLVMSAVERAIMVLGLQDVRNQLIGNEESRGISGGQRKRVNVGLEIVADPLVLFLDEPTSGLDSASCHHVVSTLRTIAHMGVTSAAVVHQPSHRSMQLFDDILLLGNGGYTVYNGPQEEIQEYFQRIGFIFPSHANPADVYLDILMGQHEMEGKPDFHPNNLVDIWKQSPAYAGLLANPDLEQLSSPVAQDQTPRVQEGSGLLQGVITIGDHRPGCCGKIYGLWGLSLIIIVEIFARIFACLCMVLVAIMKTFQKCCRRSNRGYAEVLDDSVLVHERRTPGFRLQYWWCFCRAIVQKFRAPLVVFIEYTFFAASGMALGLMAESRHETGLIVFRKDATYNIIGAGLLSAVTGLRTFGQSQVHFMRESAGGINRIAYFMALDSFGILDTLLHAVCYLLPYYSYAEPLASFGDMYLATFALMYAWTGLAYALSLVRGVNIPIFVSAVYLLHSIWYLTTDQPPQLIPLCKPSQSNIGGVGEHEVDLNPCSNGSEPCKNWVVEPLMDRNFEIIVIDEYCSIVLIICSNLFGRDASELLSF